MKVFELITALQKFSPEADVEFSEGELDMPSVIGFGQAYDRSVDEWKTTPLVVHISYNTDQWHDYKAISTSSPAEEEKEKM